MSEASPPVEDPKASSQPRPAAARPSIFRDPVVRRMAYLAAALVILFLATVVGALITGVIGQTGPRTLAEKELLVSGDAVRNGSRDAAVWGEYITALISSGQYSRAERTIAEARESVDDSATAEFTLAEVRLQSAKEEYETAIVTADKAMKQMEDVHKKKLAGAGYTAKAAQIEGLPPNYYSAVLLKAYAYRELKQWPECIKQFDTYIEKYPTAADILVDRGNAKADSGDTGGAEKDFRRSLEFMPEDNEEALAGLDKIGASK